MAIGGFISLKVAYISIPVFYIFFGIILNLIYTLGWVIEVTLLRKISELSRKIYRYSALISLAVLSLMLIFGFAISL
jgi:hypothetical protein